MFQSIVLRQFRVPIGCLMDDQYNIEAEKLLSFLEKRRKIWNFRLMVVSIFLVTVAFFAFLTWKEVSSTEISVDLVVKQLSFTLSRTWNLYGIETATFGISHLEDLELEPKTMETAVAYDPKTDQPIISQRCCHWTYFWIKTYGPRWNAFYL